jgi:hypothetical protein
LYYHELISGFQMLQKLWKIVCMRVWSRLLIRSALAIGLIAPGLVPFVRATTLEQLTLDDMSQKSTAIVRAKVTGSRSASRGSGRAADIYTYYQLQVLETWKSPGPAATFATTEVAVPGGVANGIRQIVSGAPVLEPGQEYVIFLWTSRSGLTQVIGLSQGVFKLSEESSGGGSVARRPAASELMLSRSGVPVEDHAVNMPVQDLRARVLQALGAAK